MVFNVILKYKNNMIKSHQTIENKYLLYVRKLKEGFLSFTDDLLEVFPKNNNLFMQRILSYQLPDTSLYKILNNNMNYELIFKEDENELMKLKMMNHYENYMNLNTDIYDCFMFNEVLTDKHNMNIYNDNIEMIWKWLKIICVIIDNINKLNYKPNNSKD